MATLYDGQLGDAGTADFQKKVRRFSLQGTNYSFDIATADVDDADVVRIGTIHSSTPIYEVWVGLGAGGTGATFDLGFFEAGVNHDGAVVEVDTFGDAATYASAVDAEYFTAAVGGGGAVTLTDDDRGKPVWELMGLASDPDQNLDITFTLNDAGDSDFVGGVTLVTGV